MARKGIHNSKDALGAVIQAGRDKMGLSREALAERVEISKRYLTALENEEQKPSFQTLYTMIRTLGIDANAIFYPVNPKNDAATERVYRLLSQCEKYEIEAIAALVEKLLVGKDNR